MTFVKVASRKDLESGIFGAKVKGNEILLVNSNSKYYAIGNKCTHRGCKLSNGVLEGGSVKCPCHGSMFDFKTGKVTHGPAEKPEPSFKVKVKGEDILVDV